MIITTAGDNLTSPCYTQEYKYCSNLLNPNVEIESDSYFVDIMEMDEGDEPGDRNAWKKANPIRMTYHKGIEKIEEEYEIAKEIPEKMTKFITRCLNVWVHQTENSYMDMAKWKVCEVKDIPFDLKGQTVYVGFDVSAKIDLTSVAFVLPVLTGKKDDFGKDIVNYMVFSHSFIPNEAKLRERVRRDKAPYDAWLRNGFLTLTNTEIVDQQAVIDYALRTCEENGWLIDTLCFDPANAGKMMMDLSNEGYIVEEVYQSHKSLNESTTGFREQVYCRNVMYLNNPVLNFAMSNAVIRTNNGLIKIDKDATTNRIDPVDAVLCAFKLALYHQFTSSYSGAIDRFLAEDWD